MGNAGSDITAKDLSFFEWVFRGGGWRSVINKIVFVDILIGQVLAFVTPYAIVQGASGMQPISLDAISERLMIPLTALFIGLAAATIGPYFASIDSDEFAWSLEVSGEKPNAFLFPTLLGLFVNLFTVCAWVIAGMGLFNYPQSDSLTGWCIRTALFTLLSLTIRETWGALLAMNWAVLTKIQIGRSLKKRAMEEKRTAEPPFNSDDGTSNSSRTID